MKYDFDEIVARRGTNSYKWDSAKDADVLPMWVADMDFPTAPAIIDALQKRVAHGIFGYTQVPDEYYDAVINWFSRRHGWTINRDWMLYTSGVVPAISAVIKAITEPGDNVLVQTPVYNCFFSSIRNNGCNVVRSSLLRKGDTYVMDFDNLERKAADPRTKVMLLCNPHNPVGRVWTRDELTHLGNICMKNGVTVVSDEIHCELVYPGYEYTPFASLSEAFLHRSVTCFSPSKAFNIAGLQIANIVAYDADLRRRIDKAINVNEVCDVNPFGIEATIAAYNEGEEWLTQLIDYLEENYIAMKSFFDENLPEFPLTKLEGTYLIWMDCSALKMKSSLSLEDELLDNAHLWLNAGSMYGIDGDKFMRWNIACPRSQMLEGLSRFKDYVAKILRKQDAER